MMNLIQIGSEQLSFSFWAGYVLFDFYEIDYSSRVQELSMKEVFNFLKQKGFGKNLDEDYHIVDNEKIYGIYNLQEIKFDDFTTCSEHEFLSNLLNFIIENCREQKLNETDLSALLSTVKNKIKPIIQEYDIFILNQKKLPLMKIPMRYDFFRSYFLLSRNYKKYLHVEVAYD